MGMTGARSPASGRPSAGARAMRIGGGVALAGLAVACLAGCATGARLEARVDQIGRALADVEAHGAMRCAPRELAVAQSQLEFARLERQRGDAARAEAHLDSADENVRAARLLSAPERCEGPSEASDARPERRAPAASMVPELPRSHAR